MFDISNSIVIHKPIAEMYAFALDQRNTPKWQKSLSGVEAPEGPITKGYQFSGIRKFMGREVKAKLEFLEVNPNSSFKLETKDSPVHMQVHVIFEPVGAATRMTTYIHAEVGGFFKVAEGMVAKQMKTQMSQDDRALKELMEN